MRTLLSLPMAVVLCALPLSTPLRADEVEDAIAAGLEAYQAGDIALAREELDFAATLLSQMKADGLAAFLPAAPEGWTRAEGETQALGAALFGGGLTAEAIDARDGAAMTMRFMADNPMDAAMSGVFDSAVAMGAMGRVARINRQKVIVTPDGELQALVNRRVLVSISGDGSPDEKVALFAAIDIAGLREF